ncbi:carbohydrate kinase family protein [Phytoactinopolyspora mesophila]|uniref:Ribokinase n=1 Tax=Phytoactinopolyspora mesophila TaxID=2650750 RepID=A0A7K3LYR6_9ACTN|nr:PfkB family carbohydrate kinase [Phytoactinopolyspora mesophila]NDL56149.1 ribokinase [Phytoactinopolyspora mesophila]
MTHQSDGPLIFVGLATLDAIALVERYPQPDERVLADDVTYAGGGPAATAAVAAARLGVPDVAFLGAVGDDEDGQRVVTDLQAEGVDTSGVRRIPGTRTPASVVVVDHSQGTRAISHRSGPRLEIDAGQRSRMVGAAWVHTDHVGWPAFSATFAGSQKDQPRLSVDGGNPIDGFTPAGVDLYVPTVEALTVRYGECQAEDLLDAAQADGARTVVATRGAQGSIAVGSGGQRYQAPGFPAQVHSTLGAGDVFHGALLAAIHHGADLPECLAYANVTAALACRGLDGRSAIPTHDEVRRHLADLA